MTSYCRRVRSQRKIPLLYWSGTRVSISLPSRKQYPFVVSYCPLPFFHRQPVSTTGWYKYSAILHIVSSASAALSKWNDKSSASTSPKDSSDIVLILPARGWMLTAYLLILFTMSRITVISCICTSCYSPVSPIGQVD